MQHLGVSLGQGEPQDILPQIINTHGTRVQAAEIHHSQHILEKKGRERTFHKIKNKILLVYVVHDIKRQAIIIISLL
jgi:hypothetical protein